MDTSGGETGELDLEKQHKIEAILNCLIETI